MTPDDLDEFIEKLPVTGTNELPASPGAVLPADPNMSSITITKMAENLDHNDGFTYVDDTVRYTITVANSQRDTAWMAVVVRDDVPEGIEPVDGTFKVIKADGTEVEVPNDAYDKATRILAVNVGDVEVGTNVKFVFDAKYRRRGTGLRCGQHCQGLRLAAQRHSGRRAEQPCPAGQQVRAARRMARL